MGEVEVIPHTEAIGSSSDANADVSGSTTSAPVGSVPSSSSDSLMADIDQPLTAAQADDLQDIDEPADDIKESTADSDTVMPASAAPTLEEADDSIANASDADMVAPVSETDVMMEASALATADDGISSMPKKVADDMMQYVDMTGGLVIEP